MKGSSSDHQQQEGDGGYRMSPESPSADTRQGYRTFPPPVSECVCVCGGLCSFSPSLSHTQQKVVTMDDDLSRWGGGGHVMSWRTDLNQRGQAGMV